MSEWHIVRFVDDLNAPHCDPAFIRVQQEWQKVRGKAVRIGQPMRIEDWLKMFPASAELREWCDCEWMFPVGDETLAVVGKTDPNRWVCRRMLEMD